MTGITEAISAASNQTLFLYFFRSVPPHPARLDKYLDSFDLVLVDDQTMDVANWIMAKIAADSNANGNNGATNGKGEA